MKITSVSKNRLSTIILFLLVLFFVPFNAMAQHKQKKMSPVDHILNNIKPPEFKNAKYRITSFGIYAVGVDGNPLKNISLKNVTVLNTPRDAVVYNAENLKYFGVVINGMDLKKPMKTGVVALHTD